MTSLEEVFLKSNELLHGEKAQGENGDLAKTNGVADHVEENEVPHDTMNLVGKGTLCQGIGALIIKRLQIYKRDTSSYICELFVPLLLVTVGVILSLTVSGITIANPRAIVP